MSNEITDLTTEECAVEVPSPTEGIFTVKIDASSLTDDELQALEDLEHDD